MDAIRQRLDVEILRPIRFRQPFFTDESGEAFARADLLAKYNSALENIQFGSGVASVDQQPKSAERKEVNEFILLLTELITVDQSIRDLLNGVELDRTGRADMRLKTAVEQGRLIQFPKLKHLVMQHFKSAGMRFSSTPSFTSSPPPTSGITFLVKEVAMSYENFILISPDPAPYFFVEPGSGLEVRASYIGRRAKEVYLQFAPATSVIHGAPGGLVRLDCDGSRYASFRIPDNLTPSEVKRIQESKADLQVTGTDLDGRPAYLTISFTLPEHKPSDEAAADHVKARIQAKISALEAEIEHLRSTIA